MLHELEILLACIFVMFLIVIVVLHWLDRSSVLVEAKLSWIVLQPGHDGDPHCKGVKLEHPHGSPLGLVLLSGV